MGSSREPIERERRRAWRIGVGEDGAELVSVLLAVSESTMVALFGERGGGALADRRRNHDEAKGVHGRLVVYQRLATTAGVGRVGCRWRWPSEKLPEAVRLDEPRNLFAAVEGRRSRPPSKAALLPRLSPLSRWSGEAVGECGRICDGLREDDRESRPPPPTPRVGLREGDRESRPPMPKSLVALLVRGTARRSVGDGALGDGDLLPARSASSARRSFSCRCWISARRRRSSRCFSCCRFRASSRLCVKRLLRLTGAGAAPPWRRPPPPLSLSLSDIATHCAGGWGASVGAPELLGVEVGQVGLVLCA